MKAMHVRSISVVLTGTLLALAASTTLAGVIALKRDAGLASGGAIDARFAGATVITTTVNDTDLYDAQDSRWASVGTSPFVYGAYVLYRFDLSAVPDLAHKRINLAQLRLFHREGNHDGNVAMVLTHDWLEGPGSQYWNYPGALGGASWAHPAGHNTGPNQNASGGTTPPLQSWGYNSDSMFNPSVDMGPIQRPSSAPAVWGGANVIDVTAHVQAWVSNVLPNYGWGVDCGFQHYMSEAGTDLEPVLFIDYGTASDPMPPAAVADLAAGGATSASLTLTWTAPGDDGNTGAAASYDIRYSTSPVNGSNWAIARQVTGEPLPLVAGTSQSVVVSGLAANTNYYFALKAFDEVPNGSLLSNVAEGTTLPDTTPPAAVTNLGLTNILSDTVTLTWTAPGDDGMTGTAASYDIRYSTSPIDESNWAAATQLTGEPVPTAALTSQDMTITGLVDDTTYYFAIKTADEVGNISALSNVATTRTPKDTIAPAAVADLAITKPKASTVTLTWTAPGDDGNTGKAASYEVRYSTSAINDGNWDSAIQVTGAPLPAIAGTAQKMLIRNLRSETTYCFAIKAADEVGNVAALSNIATGQTTERSPINRPVLCQDDFEYLGAFVVPYSAGSWSTSFNGSGLAIRRVNGQLRLITGGHRQQSDPVYEMTFPGWGNVYGQWPQATLTNSWGTSVYGTPSMKATLGTDIWTGGLTYDQVNDRLYFSYASGYNVAQLNNPSLGYAQLNGASPVAHGPWKGPDVIANTQRIRGGTLLIPQWFADAYLGGRTLGLGFGGPFSGNSACSQGPYLAAAYPPNDSTGDLDVIRLIDHPNDGNMAHWGTRDAGYWSTIYWCPNPVNGVGYWTFMDLIDAGVAWIDLPDKQGLVLSALMAYDEIWYRGGKSGCDRTSILWWAYDPAELAAVAQGQKQPWDPYRESWSMPYPAPFTNCETYGFAFDAETRTLFAITGSAYSYSGSWYPLVHGWRVKESFNICDINKDGYVDVEDLLTFVGAFGSAAGDPSWDIRCDFNSDGNVDVVDLLTFVENFGQ